MKPFARTQISFAAMAACLFFLAAPRHAWAQG